MTRTGRWAVAVIICRLPPPGDRNIRFEELSALAYDLTWTWDRRIRDLFQALDPDRWVEARGNPVAMLNRLDRGQLEARLGRVEVPRQEPPPGAQDFTQPDLGEGVAYFSMEFGITDCLPIFSGGLGVLAADHLKAAAQAGLPVTGVGLFYRTAFARQRVSVDGAQVSDFPTSVVADLPIRPIIVDGRQLQVEVPVGAEVVRAQAWEARLGAVRLVLLDTAVATNPEHLRDITERLYVPESDRRLRQEIVLGIGGVRVLRALGLEPSVFHLNEGHSFLACLELTRERLGAGMNLEEARRAVAAGAVFTTHTPIAAGSDYFTQDLVSELLGPYLDEVGVGLEEFMDSGRAHPGDREEMLCTTYVALRSCDHRVGVSRLHGEVSRRLWKDAWPGVDEDDVPIGSVTNGVHMPTWVAGPVAHLLERHLGPQWSQLDPDHPRWAAVAEMPDADLWAAHQELKERLMEAVAEARGGDPGLFSPATLTIGFSRRFAHYKRAGLLLSDEERLVGILGRAGREVQLVFSGKAHPADTMGQDILSTIVLYSRREPRMAFIEDYGMEIARLMVQGADVWLNNPRRLVEASGTSGMKAGANGVLNLSIPDGWWDEGRRSAAGFTIPSRTTLDDPESDDEAEAEALYELLEQRVVPLFYDRDPNGLPSGWIAMMRDSIRHVAANFSSRRMVLDYCRQCYVPAAARSHTTPIGGRLITVENG